MIQELGHSLKGASANLGLALLKKASFSLEVAGREKKIDQAQSALHLLETEIHRLRNYLHESPYRKQTA